MKESIKATLEQLRPLRGDELLGLHRTRSIARVGVITMLNKFGGGFLTLCSTVVLSRLLPPSAFGLLALATFFQMLLQTVGGQGFTESLVQVKELSQDKLSGIFWFNIAVGGLLGLILVVLGPVLAGFYEEPELVGICRVLGIVFFLQNFCQTHLALLRRSMKAELQALTSLLPSLIYLPLAISFALLGMDVWSLIVASGLTVIVRQFVVLYFIRWSPGGVKRGVGLRPMLKYGVRSTLGGLLTFLSMNFQTLALGKFASAVDVGFYNRAQSLYQKPIREFAWPLIGALMPLMSSFQDDREQLLGLVNRATWLMGLCLLPGTITIIAFGDWIILFLLGEQWSVTGEVLRWIALAQLPTTINTSLTRANAAIGRPARGMWFNLGVLPILLIGVMQTAPNGAVAVAQFVTVLRLAVYPILVFINLRGSGMDSLRYGRNTAILLAFTACLIGLSLFVRSNAVLFFEGSWAQFAFTLMWCLMLFLCFYIFYRAVEPGRCVLYWLHQKFGVQLRFWLNSLPFINI